MSRRYLMSLDPWLETIESDSRKVMREMHCAVQEATDGY